MKILCQVTSQGLVPMYEDDYEEKQRLKIGRVVEAEIKTPRNYLFHKKFAALVRLTWENLPERLQTMLNIRSWDDMLTSIKLDLGYAHTIWYGNKEVVILDSIAFKNMDELEFERFYDRAVDVILALYLRGTSKEDLNREVEEKFKSRNYNEYFQA